MHSSGPSLTTPTRPSAAREPAAAPAMPYLGFGLGLRPQHYADILDGVAPRVDWFEYIAENYMVPGGRPLKMLEKVAERFPLVQHGVSLSIASTAPPDFDYLARLKAVADRFRPKWISDHLCWTGVHGVNLHDLLPIPYSREALDHVSSRIELVQDFLGRPLVIENVSTYVNFAQSEMTEWEFLTAVVKKTGCRLLFDVNNVFVSAYNHGYDAQAFLDGIPVDAVQQFHLAGHSDMGTYIIDTHDHAVRGEVWDLFRAAWRRFGPVSTMIERDDNIPPLAEVVAELETARGIAAEVDADRADRRP
jgi:uncharacterized protein